MAVKQTKTESFSKSHWADLKASMGVNSQKEETLLKKLRHPNIVSYIDSIHEEDLNRFNLVQEYCESGSFAFIVKESGPIPESLSST